MDMNIAGAYLYRCDAHTTPGTFMEQLKTYLLKAGVQMHKETNVLQLLSSGKRIQTVSTDKGDFTADEVVIASGAWSQQLLKSVGINLPVQAGKGYRLNEEQPTGISIPAILMERKSCRHPHARFYPFFRVPWKLLG